MDKGGKITIDVWKNHRVKLLDLKENADVKAFLISVHF